jgi:hypothetical protein
MIASDCFFDSFYSFSFCDGNFQKYLLVKCGRAQHLDRGRRTGTYLTIQNQKRNSQFHNFWTVVNITLVLCYPSALLRVTIPWEAATKRSSPMRPPLKD